MRLQALCILLPCAALVACQSGPPPAQARLQDSHVDIGPDRVDTFRVTSVGLIGGPVPVAEPIKHLHDDNTYPIDAGRVVHVAIEGQMNYTSSFKSLFWSPHRVTGRIDLVAPPDAFYVVRGEIGPTESVVWLEDAATHAVIDHKFTVTLPADAPAPSADTATSVPGIGER